MKQTQRILLQIINAESIRDVYRRVTPQIAPTERKQFNYIHSETNNRIEDPEEIHRQLLRYTRKKFHEVKGLTIACPIFQNYIGTYGQKQGAKNILCGETDWNCIPECPWTRAFISKMERPVSDIKELNPAITGKQISKLWLHTRVSTAS